MACLGGQPIAEPGIANQTVGGLVTAKASLGYETQLGL